MSENPINKCHDSSNPVAGVLSRSYAFLKESDNADSGWVDVRAMRAMSVHTFGTFGGGSVQLYASNAVDPESSEDTGIAVGSAINSASIVAITSPYRYMRAVFSGATSGSINVMAHGVA